MSMPRVFVHRSATNDYHAWRIGAAVLEVGGEVVAVTREPVTPRLGELVTQYRVWAVLPEASVATLDAVLAEECVPGPEGGEP